MSSYKIFKDNAEFTRTSLVNESVEQTITEKIKNNNNPLTSRGKSALSVDSSGTANDTTVVAQETFATEHESHKPVDIEAAKIQAHALGRQEAEQEIRRELQLTVDAFTCACTEINDLHTNLLEQSRGDTINLIMALSKKIINRELNTDREAIVRTLQQAIEISLDSSEYEISLNPDDLAIVENMQEDFNQRTGRLKQIYLKTDSSISRGGCRLESNICTVDATIEAQMESAREFLEEHGTVLQETGDRGQGTEQITKSEVQSPEVKA